MNSKIKAKPTITVKLKVEYNEVPKWFRLKVEFMFILGLISLIIPINSLSISIISQKIVLNIRNIKIEVFLNSKFGIKAVTYANITSRPPM